MTQPIVCVGTEADVLKKPCKSTGFNSEICDRKLLTVSVAHDDSRGGGNPIYPAMGARLRTSGMTD